MLHQDVEDIKRQSALFILKMKEHQRLSQVAIDDIVENAKHLFEMTVEHAESGIRAKLAEAGVDVDLLPSTSLLEDIRDPFQGLQTCHYQEKYFVENLVS